MTDRSIFSFSWLFSILSFLAADPILLVIAVIAGVIVLAISLGLIIYWGITTAVIFLVVSGGALLFLNYTHIVRLKDYPLLFTIPFILFLVGYAGERYSVIDASVAVNTNAVNPAAYLLMQLFIAIIVIVGVVAVIKKRKK